MKRAAPKAGEQVFKSALIEQDATRPRTIRFVASSEIVDSYGDIIRTSGWDLSRFKDNPVLLWGHQSRELPIGTASAWVDEGRKQLLADATFMTAAENEWADQVWRVIEAGALRAVSVGFLPTVEPNILRDEKNQWITGFEFVGQQLLELSVVSVPANPEALALARSVASDETTRRLFIPDDARAVAHVAAEGRRRSIALARLRGQ